MRREEARILSIAIRRLTSRIRSVLELKELRELSAQDFQSIWLGRKEAERPDRLYLPCLPRLCLHSRSISISLQKYRLTTTGVTGFGLSGRNCCSPIDGSTPSRPRISARTRLA